MSRTRARMMYSEGWQQRFEAWGFGRFEDLFEYDQGPLVNRNTKRNVIEMRLGAKDRPEIFFMKRFFQPHWKDVFFTRRNFGAMCSQAACEWKNAHALREIGVGTYEPVCYGERTCWGIERQSFFITRQIDGICLTDWLEQHRPDTASPEMEGMIASLGRLFRRVHDSGIRLPDLYVWHVFLLGNSSPSFFEDSFALIDLHRMMIGRKDLRQRARDLGAFLYSMAEPYFNDRLRRRLIEVYLEGGFVPDRDRFVSTVERRSQMLQRRRRTPDYAASQAPSSGGGITGSSGE